MSRLGTALLSAAVLYCLIGVTQPAPQIPAQPRTVTTARVTWYPISAYSGTMADQQPVYPGAFACPVWAMGETVTVLAVGVVGTCEDTGDPTYFNAAPFKLDVAAYRRPWWMTDDYYDLDIEP